MISSQKATVKITKCKLAIAIIWSILYQTLSEYAKHFLQCLHMMLRIKLRKTPLLEADVVITLINKDTMYPKLKKQTKLITTSNNRAQGQIFINSCINNNVMLKKNVQPCIGIKILQYALYQNYLYTHKLLIMRRKSPTDFTMHYVTYNVLH